MNGQTKTEEKTSLEIRRVINAPRARVYAAWTDPAQLKEWWRPEGVRTREFEADARVGEKYRWDVFNQEGEEMSVFGEYLELTPGRRIASTWKWDDDEDWKSHDGIVTIELSDRDGDTELLLKARAIAERRVTRSSQRRLEQRSRSARKILPQVSR